MPAKKILAALAKLDVNNDNHWTEDGLPRMDTMKLMAGDQSLTRELVTAAAPDFTRAAPLSEKQAAQAGVTAAATTGGDASNTTENGGQPAASAPSSVPGSDSGSDPVTGLPTATPPIVVGDEQVKSPSAFLKPDAGQPVYRNAEPIDTDPQVKSRMSELPPNASQPTPPTGAALSEAVVSTASQESGNVTSTANPKGQPAPRTGLHADLDAAQAALVEAAGRKAEADAAHEEAMAAVDRIAQTLDESGASEKLSDHLSGYFNRQHKNLAQRAAVKQREEARERGPATPTKAPIDQTLQSRPRQKK